MKERGCLSRTGPEGEILYPVDGSVFIGSGSGCEVVVKDAAPRQCQIVRTSEGFVVHDLTGQKVTRVNGARVEHQLLRDGETVKVGSAEFRFTVTAEPEEELVAVAVAPPRLRERPALATPAAPRSRALLIGSVAAAALVLVALLIVVSSRSSNADRKTARRELRPARSESITPGSGAVREPGIVAAPAPRQDPGGVAPRPAEPVRIVEPAPIPEFVTPVFPDLPSVKPAPAVDAREGILRFFDQPDRVDAAVESAARSSSKFPLRYAALLLSLHRTLARGTGHEAAHREILEISAVGAPRGAADHLRALAASLKNAVACRDCTTGKVTCERCQGKGRIDLDCVACQGQGRVRPSGAVGDAQVTVKCRNCEGLKVFRGVTCPSCARSGKSACPSCKGKPWSDARCIRPECKEGRLACPQCQGKGWELMRCPFCTGGRARAPGAVGDADVTMKCRNCEVDGQQGNGTLRSDCKACSRTGRIHCDGCGGAFGRRLAEASRPIPVSRVFTVERCGECSGAGCDRCLGLGSRIRPVADPSRVID